MDKNITQFFSNQDPVVELGVLSWNFFYSEFLYNGFLKI